MSKKFLFIALVPSPKGVIPLTTCGDCGAPNCQASLGEYMRQTMRMTGLMYCHDLRVRSCWLMGKQMPTNRSMVMVTIM